jgi:microcystin-dependent protein
VGGQDFHPLVPGEVPAHSHQLQGSGATPSSINPTGTLFATSTGTPKLYTAPSNVVAMNGGSISFAGGGQPHENRTPFLVMNWCIATAGIFPSPN